MKRVCDAIFNNKIIQHLLWARPIHKLYFDLKQSYKYIILFNFFIHRRKFRENLTKKLIRLVLEVGHKISRVLRIAENSIISYLDILKGKNVSITDVI